MSKYAFSKLQKLIRRYHNLQVKRRIDNEDAKKSKVNIYKELLIQDNDTSQLILMKTLFFWISIGNIEQFTSSSLPVGWAIKPGNFLPQLKVIYRIRGNHKTGNYDFVIPHYTGIKEPKLPSFKKGSTRAALVLSDGSSFIVNAINEAEGKRVIAQISKYISKQFLTQDIRYTKNARVKVDEMELVRADYFPRGQSETVPLWRHYYKV